MKKRYKFLQNGKIFLCSDNIFWNGQKELLAAGINVACPAQVLEHCSTINSDFWHDVREQLHAKLSKDIRTDVPFVHKVETLTLPVRKVTDEELAKALNDIEELKQKGDKSLKNGWLQATVKRHQDQEEHPTFTVDIHILRICDIAIATSPFELFQDYATQIKARSIEMINAMYPQK